MLIRYGGHYANCNSLVAKAAVCAQVARLHNSCKKMELSNLCVELIFLKVKVTRIFCGVWVLRYLVSDVRADFSLFYSSFVFLNFSIESGHVTSDPA